MNDTEDSIPTWKKLVAIAYLLLMILEIIIWHGRLQADFVPLDHSYVGPNIVAGVLVAEILAPITVLLLPPTRRYLACKVHNFADQKVGRIHARLDALNQRHDEMLSSHKVLMTSHQELHNKLDAIAKHQDRLPRHEG